MFSPIFVVDTEIIFGYNSGAPLSSEAVTKGVL